MNRQRWGGVLGVASALLLFVGVFILPSLPAWKVTKRYPNPAVRVAAFYNSSGNRARLIVAAYLLALAGVAFLVFLSALRARLRQAGGLAPLITDLVTGAGFLFIAMLFAASACFATVAGDIVFGHALHPSAELAAVLPQLGYPLLLIFGMLSAALLVAVVSVGALRDATVLPRWLGRVGLVVAAALLFSVFFVPMIAFVLWLLTAGIVLILRGDAELAAATAPTEKPVAPAWFGWLADAPMFIDDRLVSSFYDAVLRPDSVTTSVALSEQHATSSTDTTSFGAQVAQLMPGLGLSIGGQISATESLTRGETRTTVPIQNAPRELVKLALHYLRNYSSADPGQGDGRIWEELAPPSNEAPWKAPELSRILSRPRMLAFLDFPSGTKFVPVAAETDNGVVPIYEDLMKELQAPGGQACPSYPDDPDDPQFAQKRDAYWEWFKDNWNAMKALVALETASKGAGRLRWVNYRVPVQHGLTLHLNVVGHGDYDIGVFAYNLVKRGFRQGVRVVGTVRAEPGLNVLAIYDK